MNKNNIFRIIIFYIYPLIALLTSLIIGILIKLDLTYNILFKFPPNKVECDLFVNIFKVPISIIITAFLSWILLIIILTNYIPKSIKRVSDYSPEDFDTKNGYDLFSHLNDEQKEHKLEIIGQKKSTANSSLWASLLTFNGLLIAVLSMLLSLNKDDFSICILIISLFCIVSIFISSTLILINYNKVRYIGYLHQQLLDKKLPFTKNKAVQMYNKAMKSEDDIGINEKLSIYLVLLSFLLLIILFIFIH